MLFPRSVLLVLLVAAGAAHADDLEAYAGAWLRDDVARDDSQRDAEIERVTAEMSFVFRGVARSLMRSRMKPHPGFVLAPDGDALAFRVGDDAHAALWPDGPTRTNEEGEITDRWLPDGRLERVWSRGGDEGHGTVVWSLSEDGERLFHDTTVFNPHYEGAMRYTTTYRRADGAPAE